MRLLPAVLFVSLTASWALAEEPNQADPKPEVTRKKVPYRVVKTMPESQQVLLFDKIHGTHVVAEVGDPLDEGYSVEEIDDDEVTLIAEDGTPVILAEPPPPRQAKRFGSKAKPRPVDRPADPYAGVPDAIDAGPATAQAAPVEASPDGVPVDPYGDTAPVGVATAPRPAAKLPPAPIVDAGAPELSDPYGHPGFAAFAEAVSGEPEEAAPAPTAKAKKGKASKPAPASPDAASALASVVTGSPEPATLTATSPVPTTTPAAASASDGGGVSILARGELDAALGDFGKLAATFRASFTNDGVRFDAVHAGTLLAKIGLRKGDVLMNVDGKPVRTLDDAASLYARSTTMSMATVQVVRGGKLVVLRVAIR